jgi:ribose 5-phosphate isomerase B
VLLWSKKMCKIYIGSDKAGYEAKEEIKKILDELNYEYEDLGTNDKDKSVDYPLYAKAVAQHVANEVAKGILICGSGTGMAIVANKIKGIRAAFSYDKYSAQMARKDNDANILTLRAREFDHTLYKDIVTAFLNTDFSGEERHQRRVDENSAIEKR